MSEFQTNTDRKFFKLLGNPDPNCVMETCACKITTPFTRLFGKNEIQWYSNNLYVCMYVFLFLSRNSTNQSTKTQ